MVENENTSIMIDLLNMPESMTSNQPPIEAYIAHLNHISRPESIKPVLVSRHGFTDQAAATAAVPVCQFIEQAIHFYRASENSAPRIRPVTQYYSYLNLAVACILIYKPRGWESYRSHGAQDQTRNKKRLALATQAVKVSVGTLTLFNQIISDFSISRKTFSLRDLLVPIQMISGELSDVYKTHSDLVRVTGSVEKPEGKKVGWVSRISLDFEKYAKNSVRVFPVRRLHQTIPMLTNQYSLIYRNDEERIYESKQSWSEGNKNRAIKFHKDNFIKAANFGGHFFHFDEDAADLEMSWSTVPESPIIPTATSTLLLSFFLSSLARYRPNIVERSENSRLNILFEVFSNESDGFMIPMFRNLIYRELCIIAQREYY